MNVIEMYHKYAQRLCNGILDVYCGIVRFSGGW